MSFARTRQELNGTAYSLVNLKKSNRRFKQLLRPEERAVFDDLLNQCKLYARQAGCLVSPVKDVPLLLSMIFAQHKRLMELEERVRT